MISGSTNSLEHLLEYLHGLCLYARPDMKIQADFTGNTMKIKRRRALVLAAIPAIALLSGCVTANMHREQSEQYTEDVSSILISKDDRNIVVMTDRYHYIFDAPPALVAILKSPLHKAVRGSLSTLRIDASGKASVDCELALPANASEEQLRFARGVGFMPDYDARKPWKLKLPMQGKRYLAQGVQAPGNTVQLNQRYRVYVIADETSGQKAMKVLATPLTLAADGALLLGGVVLAPIGALLFLPIAMGSY